MKLEKLKKLKELKKLEKLRTIVLFIIVKFLTIFLIVKCKKYGLADLSNL